MRGHTHVVLVFGHGCHSVFMGAKLHICFSSRLAVKSHVNVDPQWIQRREELHTHTRTHKDEYTDMYTHEQSDKRIMSTCHKAFSCLLLSILCKCSSLLSFLTNIIIQCEHTINTKQRHHGSILIVRSLIWLQRYL